MFISCKFQTIGIEGINGTSISLYLIWLIYKNVEPMQHHNTHYHFYINTAACAHNIYIELIQSQIM